MTNDIRLREELCTYLPALESYNRASYIGIVLARTESKVEQEYVLQSLETVRQTYGMKRTKYCPKCPCPRTVSTYRRTAPFQI